MGAAALSDNNWLKAGNEVAAKYWGHLGSGSLENFKTHIQAQCEGLGLQSSWAVAESKATKPETTVAGVGNAERMQAALDQYRASGGGTMQLASENGAAAIPAKSQPQGRG